MNTLISCSIQKHFAPGALNTSCSGDILHVPEISHQTRSASTTPHTVVAVPWVTAPEVLLHCEYAARLLAFIEIRVNSKSLDFLPSALTIIGRLVAIRLLCGVLVDARHDAVVSLERLWEKKDQSVHVAYLEIHPWGELLCLKMSEQSR